MTLDARTKELGRTTLEAVQEIKAKNVVGLDLSSVESYTDFIVIASGSSDRQTMAIADNVIRRFFEKHRMHPLGTEGYAQGEWILIDFGAVIVHVFFDEVRRHYHLEDMWLNVAPVPEDKLEKLLSAKAPRVSKMAKPTKAKPTKAKAPKTRKAAPPRKKTSGGKSKKA